MNVLITGGTGGLGKAIAEAFLEKQENNVFITFRNNQEIANQMQLQHGNLHAIHCDFTDKKSVMDFIGGIEQIKPDVLINNAYGAMNQQHFVKTNEEQWLTEFEINVIPVLQITKACILAFKKNRFGRIVNVLSSAVLGAPTLGYSVYAANKSYLLSMSKSWAIENARFNISSNCISPAFMKTNLTDALDARIIEKLEQAHPLGKLLLPDQVARAAVFFAESSVDFNGINMAVTAGNPI